MSGGRGSAVLAGFLIVLLTASRTAADGPPPSRPEPSATQPIASQPVAKPPLAPTAVGQASDTRSALAEPSDPSSVFFVQRNKNGKEVHYGIRLDTSCRPVGDEPVYNYWLRPAKEGNVIEPLTFLQQRGYGLKSQKVSGAEVEVVLRALSDRLIVLVPSSGGGRCRVVSYMQIASQRSVFEKAYVFAEEGLVLPTVKYIDLFGRAEDGTPVREHLVVH